MEQWAEIRHMHFVEGVAIKEIARRTGRDRKTIRRAIRSGDPPATGERPHRPSSTPTAMRSLACCARSMASPTPASAS